jgi:glycosyltransferase involved in cell wall biosynthesis
MKTRAGLAGEVADQELRVAIVTGNLYLGGAEKQAFYIARALAEAGVEVRVYNLSRGGQYEDALRRLRVESKWFGWLPGPLLRLPLLVTALRSFRPHVIQSIHAYTNAYSALAGKALRAVSVGGLRGDLRACLEEHPRFAKYLMTWPDGIVVNSRKALDQVKHSGLLAPDRVHFLANGIDLSGLPERVGNGAEPSDSECNCACVGRLFPSKRVDLFLRALAAARSVEPKLRGTVVGYGPEAASLQRLAAELRLSDSVNFLGVREDVIDILRQASMLVLCSESEGTPNVILEAMAAGLPVITTPAGDAADVVQGAAAGYVVPFGNADAIADAMVRLARSRTLRRKFGSAGRDYVELQHAASHLGARLLRIYAEVARVSSHDRDSDLIARFTEARPAPVESSMAQWKLIEVSVWESYTSPPTSRMALPRLLLSLK